MISQQHAVELDALLLNMNTCIEKMIINTQGNKQLAEYVVETTALLEKNIQALNDVPDALSTIQYALHEVMVFTRDINKVLLDGASHIAKLNAALEQALAKVSGFEMSRLDLMGYFQRIEVLRRDIEGVQQLLTHSFNQQKSLNFIYG